MYKLYARKGAGSVAPQMVLEELGLPYEMIWISREEGRSAGYREIHPQGKVPVLELPDQQRIIESAAMVIHLCAVKPGKLAPDPGSAAHATFLQWMIFLSSSIYENYLRYYYAETYFPDWPEGARRVKEKAGEDLLANFDIVESALGPRLLGEAQSAADLYLTMLADWYDPSPEVLFERFPKIGRLAEEVCERPAVAKVMKENA